MDDGVVVVLLARVNGEEIGQHKLKLTLTKAPMTPRDVRRRYSNGRVFDVVFKNGYKKRGIWAEHAHQESSQHVAKHRKRTIKE